MIEAINQWLEWLYEEHETACAILVSTVLFALFVIGSSI